MDPITATVMAVASTALTAVSAYQQGKAADEQAQVEAGQMQRNADEAMKAGLRRA